MGDLGLPANAWSGLVSIAESDSASTTTFAGPAIVVAGTNLHGFFAQREAGPVAANRVVYACPPAAGLATAQWTEPAPHEAVSPFGLSAAANGAAAWAATPSGVWSGPLAGVSTLSARVVACSYRLTPTSSRCRLELDNGDGALNGAPNAAFPGLLVGGSLSLAAGYLTVNGVPEFGVTPAFIVDALRYVVREGQATLVIEASGPWEALARWTPPQTWQVAAGTMTRSAIASRIAARAGFSLLAASNPLQPSNDWTAYSPAFAVVPGESGAAALQRLLSVVQDFVRADAGAFTVAGLQRYRNEVLSDLPSGYWRLGEATGAATAIDASGGGRSGVYNGTVVAGQAGPLAGDPGTVALFDGATGFVSVADDNAWSVNTTGRLTVEALVRLAAAPAGPVCVVGKGVAGNFEWELLILATGEPRWQIYDPGGASRAAATAASPIAAGAWYHLVGTVVDGVSCSLSVTPLASGLTATVTSNTFALTYANGPSTIGIGRRTDGSRLLSGPIGEVAVYSTALSAARIAAHVAAIDPVDYGYGTDHDLPSLELHDAPQAHNWLRAQGPDRYAEAATHSAVALNGARLRVFRNLDATSDDKARAWAVNALRREVVEDVAGELVAPFNAGQQLYDVVSVTEPRLGVAGARYRVIACGMEYRRGPKGARYDSVLTLGGV